MKNRHHLFNHRHPDLISIFLRNTFVKNANKIHKECKKNYKRKKISTDFAEKSTQIENQIEQFPNACIFEKNNTVQIVSTQIHRTVLQHPKSNIN